MENSKNVVEYKVLDIFMVTINVISLQFLVCVYKML